MNADAFPVVIKISILRLPNFIIVIYPW
jgi:hypothetical protein